MGWKRRREKEEHALEGLAGHVVVVAGAGGILVVETDAGERLALVVGQENLPVAQEPAVHRLPREDQAETVAVARNRVEVDDRAEDIVHHQVGEGIALPGGGDGVEQVVLDEDPEGLGGLRHRALPPPGDQLIRPALYQHGPVRRLHRGVLEAGHGVQAVQLQLEVVARLRVSPHLEDRGQGGAQEGDLEVGNPVPLESQVDRFVRPQGVGDDVAVRVGRREAGRDGDGGGQALAGLGDGGWARMEVDAHESQGCESGEETPEPQRRARQAHATPVVRAGRRGGGRA